MTADRPNHPRTNGTYSIGDLARATGVKPTTIRWYEQEGWLPPPARTEGGHRAYSGAHLRRLGFIRHARDLGFESEAIRALLDLADHPDADCSAAHGLALTQIRAIDARLRRLEALRAELGRMAAGCAGGAVGECRIIETLADFTHAHCEDPSHGRP
jgi:DNA-binding transcriptional MerR regulator